MGIVLNAILPGKDYEFTGKPARADSGSFGNLGEGEERSGRSNSSASNPTPLPAYGPFFFV